MRNLLFLKKRNKKGICRNFFDRNEQSRDQDALFHVDIRREKESQWKILWLTKCLADIIYKILMEEKSLYLQLQ